MSDRPTPETDAVREHWMVKINFPYSPVPAEFARRLERERDEAREQIAKENSERENDTQAELAAWELLKETRELARELLSALKDQHNFSRHFSNSSHNSRFAKMQRDTESLLAKAKEVLP